MERWRMVSNCRGAMSAVRILSLEWAPSVLGQVRPWMRCWHSKPRERARAKERESLLGKTKAPFHFLSKKDLQILKI